MHCRSAAGCDQARFTSESGVPGRAASASRTGTLVSPTATSSSPLTTNSANGSSASVMAPTTAFSIGRTASSMRPSRSASRTFSKLAYPCGMPPCAAAATSPYAPGSPW